MTDCIHHKAGTSEAAVFDVEWCLARACVVPATIRMCVLTSIGQPDEVEGITVDARNGCRQPDPNRIRTDMYTD